MRWLKAMLSLIFFWITSAEALELQNASRVNIGSQFQVIFKQHGHLSTESFGGLFKEGFHWKRDPKREVLKSYLIWASQTKDKKMFKNINITKPTGEVVRVPSEKDFKTQTGVSEAFAMVSEVSNHLDEEGTYKIGQWEKKKDEFGGWALITILKHQEPKQRWIQVTVGMSALKPGELYEVELLKKGKKGVVSKMTTIGGGAIAGNGSTNAINGATLSGFDDWNGSQGNRWDVDTHDVKKFRILTGEGLVWSIDPLLQWIYPVGAVVQVDPH